MQIGIAPTSIVGRYSCPYDNIINTHWWNTQKSGGCIVEQATHFVDLIRHLSDADIIQSSIKAQAVGPEMRLRQMAPRPQAEHMVSKYTHDHQQNAIYHHSDQQGHHVNMLKCSTVNLCYKQNISFPIIR